MEQSPVCCHVDATHCYIMKNRLSRFALIGQSFPSAKAIKTLKLLLFGPANQTTPVFNIRIYCVQDTKDAIQVLSLSTSRYYIYSLSVVLKLNLMFWINFYLM